MRINSDGLFQRSVLADKKRTVLRTLHIGRFLLVSRHLVPIPFRAYNEAQLS